LEYQIDHKELFAHVSRDKKSRTSHRQRRLCWQPFLGPPKDDAASIGAALKKPQWVTNIVPDCNTAALLTAFEQFADDLKRSPADAALFFFSGHGMEIDGENFVVPVDFDPNTVSNSWKFGSVQKLIEDITPYSGIRIIILDACRDDPETRDVLRTKTKTKSIVLADGARMTKEVTPSLGLAAMNAADNTFVAFAAAPGQVAYTGWQKHSPFTQAILDHLDAVDLPIWNMTARVRQQVMESTEQKQIPWNNESLLYPFIFDPGSLLLFMGTAMALFALVLSVVPYSLLLWAQADMLSILLSATLPLISLAVLLFGMQSAYSRVRGDVAKVHQSRMQTAAEWRDHFFGSLQKGVVGGYTGSFLGAYVMGYFYHRVWARIDSSGSSGYDPLEPLGNALLEITVTTILTAALLGFLTLFLSRSTIGRIAFPVTDKRKMQLFGTTAGGIVTGAIAAPLITAYFGIKSRPDMTPYYLLPGGVVGAAFLVFSIVNFDLERLSSDRLWGGAKGPSLHSHAEPALPLQSSDLSI
jgi:hypothetical protein